jgi:hypothetical protein
MLKRAPKKEDWDVRSSCVTGRGRRQWSNLARRAIGAKLVALILFDRVKKAETNRIEAHENLTQKKNPAGFNSAQVNGGRRIITGSTRTQKQKRSSRAYICIYYLPVCYCFAIPCCPIAFPAVLLRESCGLYMYAYGKAISKPRCGFFTSWAASPTISWNCTVGLLPLRNKCVHICLPPSTWGGLYQIVFGWGFFFFSAWNLRSTFCPIALATLRRAQQLPSNVSQSRMSSLRLSGNRCCCCPPPLS